MQSYAIIHNHILLLHVMLEPEVLRTSSLEKKMDIYLGDQG